MRVLIFNQEKISYEADKSLKNFIYIDHLNDIDDVEYYSSIRNYDRIYIDLDNTKNYKKYLQIFRELKSVTSQAKITFTYKNFPSLKNLQSILLENYKHVESTFFNMEDFDCTLKELVLNDIENEFYECPEMIKSLSINTKTQTIKINSGLEDEISITMENKKSFQLLVFFVRHYGEVLNMSALLSGTAKEPELASFSPIENAISIIRSQVSNFKSSIKSIKTIGYEFNLGT